MKRKLSKLLALALTLAAVCALATVSVGAEATTYTPIGGSTTVTKNLVVASNANIPDITFAYTITRGTPVAATATTIEILASDVTASIGNAAYTNADTAGAHNGLPTDSNSEPPTPGYRYAQKSVSVTFPVGSFTKPGVYRYVINETDGGRPGVTYDPTPRYLDVFVVANSENELSVNSYTLRSTANTIGTNGEYTTDPGVKSGGYTNQIDQYDFEFTKTIAGNQGDKNNRFTFTLNISNAIPGVYPIEATDVTGTPTSITVASDGTATGTYDLTNGSSLKVLKLNRNAVCTVSEDAEDYTATHVVDSGSSVTGVTSGAITLADAGHKVDFTNTRDGVIPTGVLLTVAPFAVGLFLFGALGVYFVARKRRYEDE